jgi:hypothetical protein
MYIKQAGGGAGSNSNNRTNDPYPSGNNTAFTDTSVPNSLSWAGSNTNKPVTLITHNTADRTVSFRFMDSPGYYDASLARFVNLPLAGYDTGEREIMVELENSGRTFTSAIIDWSIDGRPQIPYNRTGSFLFGQKETITLGNARLTPGTHILSASVAVAGDENPDNNSLTATIEIKEKETLPYATEFNGSLAGWESVDIRGGIDWQWSDLSYYLEYMPINMSTYANGYALYGLVRNGDQLGPYPAQAALVSPPFDFSSVTSAIDLSFESVAMAYDVPTTLQIQVSADNFQNQTYALWSYTIPEGWTEMPLRPVIDLSAFAGLPEVRIRFLYDGGHAFAWAIDDIKISPNNTPRLKSLTVTPGTLFPDFNPGTTHYSVTVPNEASSINIQAEALNPTDIVAGTGTKPLDEGYNTFSVEVSAPDNSDHLSYTLMVKREGQPFSVPFTEDFESGASKWIFVNGIQANQWHIGTATAASGNFSAYISNNGGLSNNYDSNYSSVYLYCDVYFTPQTGNLTAYELSFDWKGYGESCCDFLRVLITDTDTEPVPGYEFLYNSIWLGEYKGSQAWQKEGIELPGDYSGTKKRLVFQWVNDSSIEGQPPAAIDNIRIQAINPNEVLLSSLTVSEGTLSPAFDPNTFDYNVFVNRDITSIDIDASAMHAGNQVWGTGTYFLDEGDNRFEISVYDPYSGVQNIYRVTVRRSLSLYEIPFLEDFEGLSGVNWIFANGTETNRWYIGGATAASGLQSAYISPDRGATNSYLSSPSNFVYFYTDIYVTPASATDGYYQLSFDRKGLGEVYFDYLSVLTVPYDVEPVAGYEMSNAVRRGQFSDAPDWQRTKINLYDWSECPGTIQRLVFMWTNNSGLERQPPVAIDNIGVKYLSPADATLSNLSVSRGVLSPAFEPGVFDYRVNVDGNVSRIQLSAEANNPGATVTGTGEMNLNIGENRFSILVVSENTGSRNTYSVTVTRGTTGLENPEAALKVYPVPTTGKLYIENAGDAEIFLYNLPGELLLRTRQNTIDLSARPDGVYLLQIGEKKVKVVKR